MALRSFGDLWATNANNEDLAGRVEEVNLNELHEFENHPFPVKDDEDMLKLVDSISKIGVNEPILARPRPDGGYEIISGHRRVRASQLAEMETIPAVIKNIDDDTATILMVDSNLKREHLSIMEKARAFKMRYDACDRRSLKNDYQEAGKKLTNSTRKEFAEMVGESESTVFRLIRLTYLIPFFKDMIDKGTIKPYIGAEISFLPDDMQTTLGSYMQERKIKLTPELIKEFRRLDELGELDSETMWNVIIDNETSEKPKAAKKNTFKYPKEIRSKMPADLSDDGITAYLCDVIDFYNEYKAEVENDIEDGRMHY
jgi:ParB family chromosome partitioning protein